CSAWPRTTCARSVEGSREDGAMRLAMVGLGRMGGNMTTRLIQAGHEVVAFDLHEDARKAAAADGATPAATLSEAVAALSAPRVVWIMVPAGAPTSATITQLAELLEPGDVIVDGGNSNYLDSSSRAAELSHHNLHFIDAGVSGG